MAECNCGTGSLPIIKQGDAYAVQVSLTFNGEPIVYSDLDLIEEIEFTFGELAPMRFKPKDIYNTTIGAFLVPLTQRQTFMLEDGKILVDCRVQFWGGDVVGVSRMVRVFVREALSWEILPEKPYHEITPPSPSDVLVLPLTVTANGTYTAPSGRAYSPVVVNVPQSGGSDVTVEPLTITTNGTYTAPSGSAYSPVTVSVPQGSADLPFEFGDIPDYVKSEAYTVAQKVRAVQTSKTLTAIVYADPHHCASQSDTGWQTQTNISTLHAAMGMALVAAMCDIDLAINCGDYTFGNQTTTLPLFIEQCQQLNEYQDYAFGGLPALYCVGNHDTGEYYERGGGQLYGASTVYNLIGGRNADGTTVMGSTEFGYCYRDFPTKKVRVICLNTVEGDTIEGEDATYCCSDVQLLWFAQTLYSIGANADWSIIVVSHYPLDYGGNYKSGNLLYEYINGGSVTYNGTTVNFSGHNAAKFVAQYHGHTHCLKVAKINRIQNNAGTEFDAWRIATPSGTYFRNNDYAGHPLYGIDFGESVTYSKTANSGKDTAFVVNIYDPDRDLVTSVCYGAGYDRAIGVGSTTYRRITQNLSHVESTNDASAVVDGAAFSTTITPSSGYDLQPITVTMGGVDVTSQVVTMHEESQPDTHSVTNHLTNVTNSNNAYTVEDSASYVATLTPTSGYEIQSVSITMGGIDVSSYYSSGTINIPSVTGDVVITARATQITSYTNQVPISTDANGAVYNNGLGYQNGVRLNSSGAEAEGSGMAVTGFIPFTKGQTIRLGGDGITYDEYGCMMYFYDSSKTAISSKGVDYQRVGNANYGTWATEANTAFTFTPSVNYPNPDVSSGYIRISAKGLGENMIVTINEPIE